MIAQNEIKLQRGLANKTENCTVSDKHCNERILAQKKEWWLARLFDT